ncbi:MAG: polymer-forming cytoskeletal protein [Pelovirga sp.]
MTAAVVLVFICCHAGQLIFKGVAQKGGHMFSCNNKRSSSDVVDVYISRGITIEGNLSFNLSAIIEGNFNGNIKKGRYLTAAENSHITGNIQVDYIVICGCVTGNINAAKSVNVKKTAKIYGDIETPELNLAKGAVFTGKFKMLSKQLQEIVPIEQRIFDTVKTNAKMTR